MKKKLALLGAVVMVGTSLVPTIASADDPAFTCTDAGGVWVVVTEVGQNCAWNNPATGLEALSQAGFWVSEAPSDKGFIIQISGFPADANPAPSVPYWAYFTAQANAQLGSHTGFTSWTYSDSGAYTEGSRPQPGSVQGWRFGNGEQPATLPTRTLTQPEVPAETTTAPGQPTSTSNSTHESTNSESSASASETASQSSAAASSSSASGAPSSQNPSASVSGVMPISEQPGSTPIGWIALGIAGVAGIVSFAWFKLRGRAKA